MLHKVWFVVIGLCLISSSANGKDYFGFNFETDVRTVAIEKLDDFWIDYQQQPKQLRFIRSGMLRLLASYLQQGTLTFDAQDRLISIEVVAEYTDDTVQRLVKHFNEDYDFDQTEQPLRVSWFTAGTQWQQRDPRGMQWRFAITTQDIRIRVSPGADH